MHRKKIPLADVFDARALRVIVDDEHGTRMQEAIQACYRWEQPVLSLVLAARQATAEQQEGLLAPFWIAIGLCQGGLACTFRALHAPYLLPHPP